IRASNTDHAHELGEFYKNLFADDFYLEITYHPEVEGHEDAMTKLIDFAKTDNIKMVAAHDTYYIKPDDKKARETLISFQDQFSERNREDEADFSFISPETAEIYFGEKLNLPEALDN